MKIKGRILTLALAMWLSVPLFPQVRAEEAERMPFDVDARSAVLMEAETGTVLYAKNPDEALPPASVTKIMTLLLVMEAVDEGRMAMTDTIRASEYAASMGGSQIYLEPGEEMTVEDLIKSTVVASANDAAVALAETVSGTESAFVARMNERAAELGMEHTHFENVTGLDDDTQNHVTSALDIARMSRALLTHETILRYSTIWMDSVRGGAFGLTNTNRLVRFYRGITGLKTGSTSKAKFCISATARRDGMHLIAVIMGAPSRDVRNEMAKRLLDWGFAGYSLFRSPAGTAGEVAVPGGAAPVCPTQYGAFTALLKKGQAQNVRREIELAASVPAPVAAGQTLGRVVYKLGDEVIGTCGITAAADVEKIGFWTLFSRMARRMLLGR